MKHMACENQPAAAVMLGTPQPPHRPTAIKGGATAAVPGGSEGRKQLEWLLFQRGAWVCREQGRASETWPNAAADCAQPRQHATVGSPGTSHSSGR